MVQGLYKLFKLSFLMKYYTIVYYHLCSHNYREKNHYYYNETVHCSTHAYCAVLLVTKRKLEYAEQGLRRFSMRF